VRKTCFDKTNPSAIVVEELLSREGEFVWYCNTLFASCFFISFVVVLSFTRGFGVCSLQQMTIRVQDPQSIPALEQSKAGFQILKQ
jgi:hypothetical protein